MDRIWDMVMVEITMITCQHEWKWVDDGDYGSDYYCVICGKRKGKQRGTW